MRGLRWVELRRPRRDEATTGDDRRLSPRRSRIAHRTSQLSASSRLLHRIDHLSSLPSVAVAVIAIVIASVAIGVGLGFPVGWYSGFGTAASAITLLMVFAIQHTQAREQAATQRKLDELIRALPGASEKLMMLEEAPKDFLQEVEEDQRGTRTGVDERASTAGG